jgi:4-hydroxy-3-polyprenylbenzoate decarboxylase
MNKPESPTRTYNDLRQHLDVLRREGLLLTDRPPVDKDAELHPLVRWQYVGGIEEHERKAFLFTNVVDALGRKYKFPVVVGATREPRIYCLGMERQPRTCSRAGSARREADRAARSSRTRRARKSCITGDALKGEATGSMRCRSGLDARIRQRAHADRDET